MTEAWIVETQTKLGGVITAPKLTDKLLSKPPFRFLHDVAMAFMKATNLLDGLFTDIELNPGREADKDVKMSFLQKLITVVSIANDTQCAAKASKIIAGAEPEATNQMLVLLANLKDMPKSKVDKAVKATLSGGEAEAAPAAAPAARPAPAQEAPPPPAAAATSERPQSQGGGRRPAPGATGAAPAPAAAAQPSSVPQVNALPNQTSDSSAPQRPMSARSGKPPPTVKESTQVVDSSEPVTKAHQANVITEAKGQEEEEGQKGDQDWLQLVEQNEAKAAQGGSVEGGNARGYLAAQAAQAKKEQEDAKKKAEADAAAAGQSTGGVVIKTRKKDDKGAGSIGTSEMSKLREQLQLLTKASNPLGKFLEALHEDIDTMARELEMWRTEARTQTVAAAEARRQTEEALRELQAKQQALEDALTEKNAQISIVRGTIQQNDKTIETLIRMVVTPDAAAKK